MAAKNLITLSILLVSSALSAQQKFMTVSPNPVPESCQQEVKLLQEEVAKIGAPDRPWAWVVFCREQDWSLMVRGAVQEKNTCCAFSILGKGYTYINGSQLLNPRRLLSPGYIVAHEIGHIVTGSTDEDAADRWAKERGFQWGKPDHS